MSSQLYNTIFLLGESYYFGINGKQQDFKKAFLCYLEAAKFEHVESLSSLG